MFNLHSSIICFSTDDFRSVEFSSLCFSSEIIFTSDVCSGVWCVCSRLVAWTLDSVTLQRLVPQISACVWLHLCKSGSRWDLFLYESLRSVSHSLCFLCEVRRERDWVMDRIQTVCFWHFRSARVLDAVLFLHKKITTFTNTEKTQHPRCSALDLTFHSQLNYF